MASSDLSSTKHIRGKVIRFSILLVLVGFLSISLFGANMDYFLPGFSNLDTKFSTPIVYQLGLFSLFVIFGIYTVVKNNHGTALLVSLILFFCVVFSTYTVSISQRLNSITSSLGLLPINEMPFSNDVLILQKGFGYKLVDPKKSILIYTDLFLVGMSSLEINQQLLKLGECRKMLEELCTEIDVSWP